MDIIIRVSCYKIISFIMKFMVKVFVVLIMREIWLFIRFWIYIEKSNLLVLFIWR